MYQTKRYDGSEIGDVFFMELPDSNEIILTPHGKTFQPKTLYHVLQYTNNETVIRIPMQCLTLGRTKGYRFSATLSGLEFHYFDGNEKCADEPSYYLETRRRSRDDILPAESTLQSLKKWIETRISNQTKRTGRFTNPNVIRPEVLKPKISYEL